MNEQSDTERSSTSGHWFGLDRLRLSDDEQTIDVTIGSESHWDRSHLRRLRQSGDLPGMVPIIDSDFSADGKPFAVTPSIDSPTLGSLIAQGDLDWVNGACVTEAAARAAYEAHLRGLFHGALSPEDVYVIDDDVAISGVGLGLGGTPPADRSEWVAPEVREGAEPTERSDVYSLGKILESSLGEALDTVPRSIRRLIMWSSSDTPEARPPSAMEFASILAEGLGEDRQVYGPAFIPTAGASDLAAQASSAVSNHTPSETAQSTASGFGAGMVGAGAAAAGAAAFMGNDDDADIADEGFSVAEADTVDVDPGVELDDDVAPDTDIDVDETAEVEVAAETSPIETVAAETGEHQIVESATEREYAAPAAAQTVDLDETYVPRQRRNRAGLVIGAILGVGLAVIAWGLLSSNDDEDVAAGDGGTEPSAAAADATEDDTEEATEDEVAEDEATEETVETTVPTTAAAAASEDETATEEEVTTPTTAATTASTEAETTVTTEAETTVTTAAETTVTTAAETTVTTEAEVEAADPVEMADGPIAASDAGIQVLHGVPGAEVDVYVNGEAIATKFVSGTIAGPIALDSGDYEVQLFAATDLAPANASDRTDSALVTQMVTVSDSAASVVAHLDADGELAVSPFLEKFSSVDPGQGRLMVRHLLATDEATATVNGEAIGNLTSGEEAAAEVAAGEVLVQILDGNSDVIAEATVEVDDGELVSLSAIGSPVDDTAEIVIQRYSGLATAPSAVPTGDSGLLNLGDDETGLRIAYGLMVVLALSGGIVAFRRQRSIS